MLQEYMIPKIVCRFLATFCQINKSTHLAVIKKLLLNFQTKFPNKNSKRNFKQNFQANISKWKWGWAWGLGWDEVGLKFSWAWVENELSWGWVEVEYKTNIGFCRVRLIVRAHFLGQLT